MTGTAAQFVRHVAEVMDGRARLSDVPGPAARGRSMVGLRRAAT
jgi:hypothetical protein